MTSSDLRERHRRALGAHTPLFYEQPVHLVRGEGVWLFDADGTRYLDAYNNVPCVGHANSRVASAMADQASTLNVHSRYLHGGVIDYAERLASLHDDSLTTTVFTCTGTEAIEVAMMTARAATGRRGIISTEATYHGNSTEVRKLSDIGRRLAAGAAPDPTIGAVPVPDLASGDLDTHLDFLGEAIEAMAASEQGFAGVLMCSLLANEGLPEIPNGYFAAATDLVHQAGGVMIADEVQAGFARSGTWWGYDRSGFVPDIAVMGKPMGAGLPLAAAMSSEELVGAFRRSTRYFNTFAASPLQAAVGMAVIDEIEDRDLLAQVNDVGGYLLEGVRAITDRPAQMGGIRGVGLFVGIDWLDEHGQPDAKGAVAIANQMKLRGVLMGRSGALDNCLKMRPPLVFEREHADVVLEAFGDVMSSVA